MGRRMVDLILAAVIALMVRINPSQALTLTEVTPSLHVVPMGEATQILCVSDSPWQWCSWKHEGSDLSLETPREAVTNATIEEGITFVKSTYGCGLDFNNVELSHSGKWLCHLAITKDVSVEESFRDEGEVDVRVARPAELVFAPDIGPEVVEGEVVDLKCSVFDDSIYPPATLTLFKLKPGQSPEIMIQDSEVGSLEYVITTTKDDDNATFTCESKQVDEDNDISYHVQAEPSEMINLVFGPSADLDEDVDEIFVFTNESVDISFEFQSKPEPSLILWHVLTASEKLEVSDEVIDHFEAFDAEDVEQALDTYVTMLRIKNLTENVTVTVMVENKFGVLEKEFFVIFDPPEVIEVAPAVAEANSLTAILAASITGLLLLLILLILLICCCCRRRRRRKDQEMAEVEVKAKDEEEETRTELLMKKPTEPKATIKPWHDEAKDAHEFQEDTLMARLDPNGGTFRGIDNLESPREMAIDVEMTRRVVTTTTVTTQQTKPSPRPSPSRTRGPGPATATITSRIPTPVHTLRVAQDAQDLAGSDLILRRGHGRGVLGLQGPLASPGGSLRLSGPTNFPVFTSTPSPRAEPSPGPGKRTSQMHFLKPGM